MTTLQEAFRLLEVKDNDTIHIRFSSETDDMIRIMSGHDAKEIFSGGLPVHAVRVRVIEGNDSTKFALLFVLR